MDAPEEPSADGLGGGAPEGASEEPPNPGALDPSAIIEQALNAKSLLKRLQWQTLRELQGCEQGLRRIDMGERSNARYEKNVATGKRLREEVDGDAAAVAAEQREPAALAEHDGGAMAAEDDSVMLIGEAPISTAAELAECAAAGSAASEAVADGGAGGGACGAAAAAAVGGGGGGSADAMAEESELPSATTGEAAPSSAAATGATRLERRSSRDGGASKQRDRKMFGVLMGTLREAKQQALASGVAAMRQQKMERVDAKLLADRERSLLAQREKLATEKVALTQQREAVLAQRAELDEIMRTVSAMVHAARLACFIRTETEPPLYYLPVKHNQATRNRLAKQRETVLQPMLAKLGELRPFIADAAAEHNQRVARVAATTATLRPIAEPPANAAETRGSPHERSPRKPRRGSTGWDVGAATVGGPSSAEVAEAMEAEEAILHDAADQPLEALLPSS